MAKVETFESSIKALEEIVYQLEKGDTSLGDALKQFEKGIGLTRTCQDLLKNAELQVETLVKSNSNDEVDNV